jgi:hypothetical protein
MRRRRQPQRRHRYEHGYGIANLELGVPITSATVFHIGSIFLKQKFFCRFRQLARRLSTGLIASCDSAASLQMRRSIRPLSSVRS